MRIHYQHGTPDLTWLKLISAAGGMAGAVALVIYPPALMGWHILGWVLAAAFGLGGLLALNFRRRLHLIITGREVILDPDGPMRRFPLKHIHHAELGSDSATPQVILVLRNGERLDISGRIGRGAKLGPVLEALGVMTRQL